MAINSNLIWLESKIDRSVSYSSYSNCYIQIRDRLTRQNSSYNQIKTRLYFLWPLSHILNPLLCSFVRDVNFFFKFKLC